MAQRTPTRVTGTRRQAPRTATYWEPPKPTAYAIFQMWGSLVWLVRDTVAILLRVGPILLAISLGVFAAHSLLVRWAAETAIDNGPLGLAILIVAVALRLTFMAVGLWIAAGVLRFDGNRMTELASTLARTTDGSHGDHGSHGAGNVADAVRLVMAPMVIVYAAWNLIDWDIHTFLVEKSSKVSELIWTTEQRGREIEFDNSNISFADGGWKTYIPWAIGLFVLKLLIDQVYRRTRWAALDIVIVYCECGWVVLGWLVLAQWWFALKDWFLSRTVTMWYREGMDRIEALGPPFAQLPEAIREWFQWVEEVAKLVGNHIMWPIIWVTLVGVIIGWVRVDDRPADTTAGRATRSLRFVLDTSTRGIRDKWIPLWHTAREVVHAGIVPMLTVAVAYALLMYGSMALRELVILMLPNDWFGPSTSYDLVLRFTEAVILPVRTAFLVAAFALVVRTVRREIGPQVAM